jgi:uncharacterized protein YdeI (YjbR/CyaY-like superfamily)
MSRLTRPHYEMPDFVCNALAARGLMDAYLRRPDYQQNDYIGWITRARQPSTREKRLTQMLDELADGKQYMKMAWYEKS